MIDQAGLRWDKGYQIACERYREINDNMAKSHYHEYLNCIIWIQANGTT